MSAKIYVPGPTGSPLVKDGQVVGHISFGGDLLLIPVAGKEVLFEMHHYFGPHPVSKKTWYPLERIPKGFWDAYERWSIGGKIVDGDRCIVPPWCPSCRGTGRTIRMIGKRTGIDEGACEQCNGKRVLKGGA